MKIYTFIKDTIKNKPRELSSSLNKLFSTEDNISQMTFPQYEEIVNQLFITEDTDGLKAVLSFYNKLVKSDIANFFHLKVNETSVSASSRTMIQNYNLIFMFHTYIDATEFLYRWSPKKEYYPLLIHIQKNKKPNKPISYIYWLYRFTEIPRALSFLKDNKIFIDFTSPEELSHLYRTIPEDEVKNFLDVLGDKNSWYLETIKQTRHFVNKVEEWEL